MARYDNTATESIDKESWQRSVHILNMFTWAQTMAIQAETIQNPFYLSVACSTMLDLLGPMYREKGRKANLETGEEATKETGGKDTEAYQRHLARLAESKKLINMYLQGNYDNSQELLDEAYRILNVLKTDLLQDADKMNLNFKKKPDVMDAWQE